MLELATALAGETPRIEWKQNAHDPDVLKAVCAMANDLENAQQPGFVVLGVDKHGQVHGVTDRAQKPIAGPGTTLDELLQSLSSRILSVKLLPQPSIDLPTHESDGKVVVVVSVQPYPVPPVVKLDGVAWVRVGTTTRKATEADLLRLSERRPVFQQPFDLRPVHGATWADLNDRALSARYDAARGDDPDTFPGLARWLEQLGLGREENGVLSPNAAALLVFGKDPQNHFSGATVEVARYLGTDVDADVGWRKTLTGTVPDQLDAAWRLFDSQQLKRADLQTGPLRTYYDEYPPGALHELIRNMLQHRLYEGTSAPCRVDWFDDRIELSNPGGPYGRASEGEFGSHSDYRNPTLTRLLADLGYVERLGRGIRRARLQLAKLGNPPLQVETDGFTRLTVRRRP